MAMGFRERRLGCRLYVDRQADAGVVKKLDRMLMDGSFPNQTELIKRGVELAYAEVYGETEGSRKSCKPKVDIEELAEEVVRALKSEIEKLLAGLEARIPVTETSEVAVISTHDTSRRNEEVTSDGEAILPSLTFSFLKGLNDD